MNELLYGVRILAEVSFVFISIHAFDRRTDRQRYPFFDIVNQLQRQIKTYMAMKADLVTNFCFFSKTDIVNSKFTILQVTAVITYSELVVSSLNHKSST